MTAPEIHSAFRGRLVCLLVLRTPGSNLCLPPAEVFVYFLRRNGLYSLTSILCSVETENKMVNVRILPVETFKNHANTAQKPEPWWSNVVNIPPSFGFIMAKRLLSMPLCSLFMKSILKHAGEFT